MAIRRVPAPMLYGANAPVRWLRTLASVIDHATAGVCCQQWQRGLVPCLQPARVVRTSRSTSHDR